MRIPVISLFIFLFLASPVRAESVYDANVRAELISEVTSVQPGMPFQVGLKLTMDEGWHTYWKNPGDSGLATEIRWVLPPGFGTGSIEWPFPERLILSDLATFGYSGEIVLLSRVTPPARLEPGTVVEIQARANWLACEKICIPGKGEFTLRLPVKAEVPLPDTANVETFAAARARLPLEKTAWQVRAEANASYVRFTFIPSTEGLGRLGSLFFFPDGGDLVRHTADQIFEEKGEFSFLWVPRSTLHRDMPDVLKGVLVSGSGWRGPGSEKAFAFQGSLGALEEKAAPPVTGAVDMSLSLALVFAFLGGLILNLMPCVLPVLSIKILGFVKQAGQDEKQVWHHSLSFTAGVLSAFWILALLLLTLRAGGEQIGWGFHLQSPFVLLFLIFLFMTLSLNLLGLFEVGTSLTGLGNVGQKAGWAGSYLSGLLAVVIATPCTAPFMGAALGFGLTQSPFISFAVFTALGLGMALPYLILSVFPALLRFLPQPGPWMVRFKQVMGAVLLLTVLWLGWVLSRQIPSAGFRLVLVSFVPLVLAGWIYGRWAQKGARSVLRQAGIVGAFVLCTFAILLASAGVRLANGVLSSSFSQAKPEGVWENYSEERLDALLSEGSPVFIDFTAAWCLTCQVNKKVALHDSRVMDAFRKKGVALLRADWTSRDETITRALAGYGRSSIPVYVFYPPESREYRLLPELLTPGTLLKELDTLNEKNEGETR